MQICCMFRIMLYEPKWEIRVSSDTSGMWKDAVNVMHRTTRNGLERLRRIEKKHENLR